MFMDIKDSKEIKWTQFSPQWFTDWTQYRPKSHQDFSVSIDNSVYNWMEREKRTRTATAIS